MLRTAGVPSSEQLSHEAAGAALGRGFSFLSPGGYRLPEPQPLVLWTAAPESDSQDAWGVRSISPGVQRSRGSETGCGPPPAEHCWQLFLPSQPADSAADSSSPQAPPAALNAQLADAEGAAQDSAAPVLTWPQPLTLLPSIAATAAPLVQQMCVAYSSQPAAAQRSPAHHRRSTTAHTSAEPDDAADGPAQDLSFERLASLQVLWRPAAALLLQSAAELSSPASMCAFTTLVQPLCMQPHMSSNNALQRT